MKLKTLMTQDESFNKEIPNSSFKTCNTSIMTRTSAATPTRQTNYSA